MQLSWRNTLDGINWQELAELYRRAPLGSKSAETLQIAFSNSRFTLFLFDGTQLVGAGRALSDGIDCSYLCDIALLPEYQGSGLGREIVSRLVALSAGHRKIILYAVPGKEAFYRRFGFRRMKTAMAIFDDPNSATERGFVEAEEL